MDITPVLVVLAVFYLLDDLRLSHLPESHCVADGSGFSIETSPLVISWMGVDMILTHGVANRCHIGHIKELQGRSSQRFE